MDIALLATRGPQAYKAANFISLPDRPADSAAKSLRHLVEKTRGIYWPSLKKTKKILYEMSFFSKSRAEMSLNI